MFVLLYAMLIRITMIPKNFVWSRRAVFDSLCIISRALLIFYVHVVKFIQIAYISVQPFVLLLHHFAFNA